MYIYFTRHGQSLWNVANKICGATDIALTDLGHEQAEELGRYIRDNNIHIDQILYSPLMRARDTAEGIAKVNHIPMFEEIRLKEQNYGRFEGTPRHGEEFEAAKHNFLYDFDGGETMAQLCARVYSLLDELKEKNDNKVYLLVAHNGISRVVESYFRNMTNDEFASFGIKNCQLRKYTF